MRKEGVFPYTELFE